MQYDLFCHSLTHNFCLPYNDYVYTINLFVCHVFSAILRSPINIKVWFCPNGLIAIKVTFLNLFFCKLHLLIFQWQQLACFNEKLVMLIISWYISLFLYLTFWLSPLQTFSLFYYLSVFLSVYLFNWLSYYVCMFICLSLPYLSITSLPSTTCPCSGIDFPKLPALMTNMLCWTHGF